LVLQGNKGSVPALARSAALLLFFRHNNNNPLNGPFTLYNTLFGSN